MEHQAVSSVVGHELGTQAGCQGREVMIEMKGGEERMDKLKKQTRPLRTDN